MLSLCERSITSRAEPLSSENDCVSISRREMTTTMATDAYIAPKHIDDDLPVYRSVSRAAVLSVLLAVLTASFPP